MRVRGLFAGNSMAPRTPAGLASLYGLVSGGPSEAKKVGQEACHEAGIKWARINL